jgi:MFS family permease
MRLDPTRRLEVPQLSAFRLALTGLLTLAVAIGIGRFAFTPILPMMQKDAGLSLRMAGVLASANYVGYLVGALSALWLQRSPATVVRASAVAIVILTAAMAATSHPAAWLAMRGLAGVVSAWALVFASAWILPQLAAQGKGWLGGVVFTGVGGGIAMSGLFCLAFLQAGWSSASAWIAMGIVALVLTLIAWPTYAAASPAASTAEAPPSWKSRDATRLVWCYGSFGFGYIIPATFLPAMAREVIPDPAIFGWAWPVFGFAAAVYALLAGWLSARLSYRSIWRAGQLIMAAGVIAPVLWAGVGGILVSAICVGGTFVVTTMTGLQEGRRVAGAAAPGLMAAMTAAFAFGQIVGPLLVSAADGNPRAMDLVLVFTAAVLVTGGLALGKGK